MLIAELDANSWAIIVGAIFIGLGQLLTMYLAWRSAEDAKKKAQEVKITLRETTEKQASKLDGIAKVGEATHILVNNNMKIQLQISAVALRRIADANPESIADEEAAKLAEASLREHEVKQKALDNKEGKAT